MGVGGMTAGQYRDPKLALLGMGLFARPHGLQNDASDPRDKQELNRSPGAMIEDWMGNGWKAMVLDKGKDVDPVSSSGRKGALKDSNTLDMSNVSQ